MGSPIDGTPPQSENLIEIIRSKTVCAVTVRRPFKRQREGKKGGAAGVPTQGHFIITKTRVIKGEEGGVAVSGCRGSMAECWWLKSEGLSSTLGGTPFLSFHLSFQRSLDDNGTDCLSSDYLYQVFGLWGSPIHRTPHAVILVTILHDQ